MGRETAILAKTSEKVAGNCFRHNVGSGLLCPRDGESGCRPAP